MSIASDRLELLEALTQYPVMTATQLAQFLKCSPDHARGLLEDGEIPFVNIGRGTRRDYRVDPVDAAVYWLSHREGLTIAEFRERHGPNGTLERARQLLTQIRRAVAA